MIAASSLWFCIMRMRGSASNTLRDPPQPEANIAGEGERLRDGEMIVKEC